MRWVLEKLVSVTMIVVIVEELLHFRIGVQPVRLGMHLPHMTLHMTGVGKVATAKVTRKLLLPWIIENALEEYPLTGMGSVVGNEGNLRVKYFCTSWVSTLKRNNRTSIGNMTVITLNIVGFEWSRTCRSSNTLFAQSSPQIWHVCRFFRCVSLCSFRPASLLNSAPHFWNFK